jgi:hypothetical protein
MGVLPLWDALAPLGCFGQLVALDDGDPLVMLGHDARHQQAAHACPDHNSMAAAMGHDAMVPFVRCARIVTTVLQEVHLT